METEKKQSVVKKWFSNLGSLYVDTYKYLWKNILGVIVVCVICFIVLQLTTAGLFRCMVLLSEAIEGKKYIAANNIVDYLKTPSTYFVIIVYLIVLGNLLVFQIGVFIYIFDESKNGRRASYRKMLGFGFHSIKKLAHPKNWLIFVFLLLIVPFADVFEFTYFKISIVVPGFILDYIKANAGLYIPYLIAVIVITIVTVLSMFSFHFFILEEKTSFFRACVKSFKIFIKNILSIIGTLLLVYLTMALAILIIVCFIVLFMGIFRGSMYTPYAYWVYVSDYFDAFSVVVILPIAFSAFSSLFYFAHKDNETYVVSAMDIHLKKNVIRNIIALVAIVGFAIVDVVLCAPNYAVYNTQHELPMTIAHRGSSIKAPENSIPAFQLAIGEKADMIELDIHQTKDKVLVVSHDSSLKRIAGIDKNVYDLTYEEITKLDVGSWFSPEYAGLKLATLEDVIKICKDKIKLMIEIKPTKYDDHLEEDLIALINKYNIKDQVIVHSLKDAPLKRIKELDPTIKTAYCMILAIGDIQTIEWSDEFTVEESNVDPELVRKVHEAGKKIHVWTINNPSSIQYLIDCGVDGIIGDNAYDIRLTTYNATYDYGFSKFLRMFSLQKLVM